MNGHSASSGYDRLNNPSITPNVFRGAHTNPNRNAGNLVSYIPTNTSSPPRRHGRYRLSSPPPPYSPAPSSSTALRHNTQQKSPITPIPTPITHTRTFDCKIISHTAKQTTFSSRKLLDDHNRNWHESPVTVRYGSNEFLEVKQLSRGVDGFLVCGKCKIRGKEASWMTEHTATCQTVKVEKRGRRKGRKLVDIVSEVLPDYNDLGDEETTIVLERVYQFLQRNGVETMKTDVHDEFTVAGGLVYELQIHLFRKLRKVFNGRVLKDPRL
ncbi:hypothetical protein HDU79_001862 [Rhizoclosmatium sp. JEL0117]|nr:hypothetical protein HDU79_001862 [Rhizoclosmatium sp. JEL0117]